MSQMAPEPAPAPAAPRRGGGSSVFTTRLGPLPMWTWLAIGAALIGLYVVFKRNQSSQQQAAQPTTTPSTPADQVPQFVNQTYTTVTAPEQGPPGPRGPAGPTGRPGVGVPPPKQVHQYSAPKGLSAANKGGGDVLVRWQDLTGVSPPPGSYTVAVYQLNGKLVRQQTVSAPDMPGGITQATVSGLHPGWTYHVNVWANGGQIGPPHSTATVRVS